jgi:tRNA modification GTPase
VHSLRDALIDLRMLVEATLDFPEEEIDFLQKRRAGPARAAAANLARVMQRAHQGALLREGLHVVIAGQPMRQELAAQRAGRSRACDRDADRRHHPRRGAADHPDRRRAAARR